MNVQFINQDIQDIIMHEGLGKKDVFVEDSKIIANTSNENLLN